MNAGATRVPFVDLEPQREELDGELRAAFDRVLESGWFILGPEVEAFEREFAEASGSLHGIGVGSGTEALHLALRACGIGTGDEVITVAHSFIATAFAITSAGATPIFVDVNAHDLLLDVDAAAAAITSRTRAIVPVHLYGRCVQMDAVCELARKHGLTVIEDAAQAHGATYRGRRAGSLGDLGCFSFYPSKNLGALGDGGAVVTRDPAVADRLRRLRNYSQTAKYHHSGLGFNSRLDEVQAALLRAKLPRLDDWNRERRSHAATYTALLKGLPVSIPPSEPGDADVFHLYVVRSERRDALQQHLREAGVETQIHYPIPIHRQPAYASATRITLPRTERAAASVLSLPMYPHLSTPQIEHVCEAVESFFERC